MIARSLPFVAALSVVAALSLNAAKAAETPQSAPAAAKGQTYRLYDGLTVYVLNEQGKDFTVDMDLFELNIYGGGPRETMYKVYDPDGKCVVRQFIPDDGITSQNFLDRLGGWDHELQYYANLYAKGTYPTVRWSAWSDPKRLNSLGRRTFQNPLKGAKGIWRIVLAGSEDNYVTLRLPPEMKYGLAGNQMWLHGSGKMLTKSYVYVPKGTVGMFFGAAEPDLPRTRNFKVTGPDGKVYFDGPATGGYTSTEGSWQKATVPFPAGGEYDGKLMTVEVTPGAGDFLVKLTLQQPKEGAFKDYVGMGSQAVFCDDKQTAEAFKGGTIVVDDLVFWHPFQVRFYQWLKTRKLDNNPALRKDLESLFDSFRLLETSDGRGAPSWVNWAYGLSGYYGCRVYRPSWLLMARQDMPEDLKAIIRDGLIMAGDRLSFAVNGERVNGNAFSQINVALWYCHRATGDALQSERFELFWDRWKNKEGWGKGAGLGPSGDSQEHFAHDMAYGSYLMDNWCGGTWVRPGIIDDAKTAGDTRFAEVVDRYRELYSYLYCREVKGAAIAANPWSSRTAATAHHGSGNWERDGHTWKGEPGKDFTVNVNGGDEWFAARRKNYYILTYHGRLTPEWLSRCFEGQVGFGGGLICQLTVPGKGPVLASTLFVSQGYGKGMDPSNWRNFHINSIVGQMWDGRPLVSSVSEHENAKLNGNTVTSSGEVRDTHVKVARSYTYQPDGIECSVNLSESDYARILSIWSHERQWSDVKEAYELIPFVANDVTGKKPSVVALMDSSGRPMSQATSKPAKANGVGIDRGGFGVKIRFDKPRNVSIGSTGSIFVQLVEPSDKSVPASEVSLKYWIVPFGN